jgi:DNA modification methylase
MSFEIITGDCLDVLALGFIPEKSIHCCVTSPPYFGLRDYGHAEQIGMEETPEQYVASMVEVFRAVRDVLKDDGTLWLNLGDSYYNYRPGKGQRQSKQSLASQKFSEVEVCHKRGRKLDGLKEKDLIGIPWRVAFALQADGWYLRQDIIWAKPNPMPESVRDRCTKSHEYIFLFSKSPKYYFDGDAIATPCKPTTVARLTQPTLEQQAGSDRVPGKTNGPVKACFGGRQKHKGYGTRIHSGREDEGDYLNKGANKRSVWTVTTKPYKGAHFATFPPDLIEPCILAGCPEGGTVLDPFGGAGTTALVAERHKRNSILIELNPSYVTLAEERIAKDRIS